MFSENEVLSLVQHLKDYTTEEIKPEIGKWAEEYTVKMDEIETELKWSKKEGQKYKSMTTGYQTIFDSLLPHRKKQLDQKDRLLAEINRKTTAQRNKGKTILVTGENGTGRSVLCKKITSDWAKGNFATFSLVFFLSMKRVRPGDVLENVIIDQYKFKKPDADVETLRDVFEQIGDRCLVILDGIDQHPQGFNSDFLTTLMSEKYSHVNFLFTTTPEFDRLKRDGFHIVAAIEPPNHTAYEQFIAHKLNVQSRLQSIETKDLIQPNIIGSKVPVSSHNPMLRTFLYVLACNNAIDLTHGEVSLGYLFTKLVSHIYKSHKFLDYVAKVIGKLALDQFENKELRCKEIPAEDPLLLQNPNNLVIFRVKALQVYLAALHFVQALDEGQPVESLLAVESMDSLLMTNYLFLYFTIWLLQESKEHPVFRNSTNVYQMLLSYMKNKIDFSQLHLEDVANVFPSLDFCLADNLKDGLVLQFLKDIVVSCENTEVLSLTPKHPVEEILPLMRPAFSRIKTVCLAIGGLALDTKLFESTRSLKRNIKASATSKATTSSDDGDSEIDVIMNFCASKNDEALLDFVHKSIRPFSLFFVNKNYNEKPMVDLTDLIRGNIRQFCVRQAACFFFANRELDICPYLTCLSFGSIGLQFNRTVFTALCKAASTEKFPNISHLSFSGCSSAIKGKLNLLFSKPWSTLTHLDVTKCDLEEQDVEVIFAATHESRENCLPNLKSLALSPQNLAIERPLEIFMRPWTTLNSLRIFDVDPKDSLFGMFQGKRSISKDFYDHLQKGVIPNLMEIGLSESCPGMLKRLPQLCIVTINGNREVDRSRLFDVEQLTTALQIEKLRHLDLSNNCITSNLPHLVCHSFPALETLILRNCMFSYVDARSLAQANGGGKFPKLKHLDISQNGCRLSDMFEFESRWDSLDTLAVGGHYTEWNTEFETLVTKSQIGCLNRLEKFEIWFQNLFHFYRSHFCQQCTRPRFGLPSDKPVPTQKDVLAPIANNIEKLQTSSLKTIYIYSEEHFFPERQEGAAEKLKIRSKNITVYFIVVPQW